MMTLPPVTNTGLVGSFEYSAATDTLVWSAPVYALHGFAPGDVVPSLDLVLSHKHPDDRDEAARMIGQVRATGRPFSLWHRILDARGAQRQVISVGAGVLDAGGQVTGFSGYIADVTEASREAVSREVAAAVEGLERSRPVIEQVKGALMLTYALDEDAAFALLRRYSQMVNVKVRDLARDFVGAMALGDFPRGTREQWDRLAAGDGLSTAEAPREQAAD